MEGRAAVDAGELAFGGAQPSIIDRVLEASGRLKAAGGAWMPGGGSALRAEQSRVLDDFARFLADVGGGPAQGAAAPFGRIIQPPRTGKTVVAAHIIARTGLPATFIVPTRTLVEQTAREMRAHAPGTAVGLFYGERKAIVEEGVNVTTYAMALAAFEAGRLPRPLREAVLVFADEGHRAMTARRLHLLRSGFDRRALRIALTATPNYDDPARRLEIYFPSLIHEIGLDEALELGLLAPLRVWVAEVDADASTVRVVAGDFEEQALGRLMSSAPFFRTTELFRYGAEPATRIGPVRHYDRVMRERREHDQWRRRHRMSVMPGGLDASSQIRGTNGAPASGAAGATQPARSTPRPKGGR